MKIGQLLFTKKMTSGVSVFARSFKEKVEQLGETVSNFAPLDEEEYAKIPQVGEALKYTTLIEHLDEAKQCDLVFGSNTTSISYINRKLPLVTTFHSVPAAALNDIPNDQKRISEPFVYKQFLKEAEKAGIPPQKDTWHNLENINLIDRYIAQNCSNLVAVSQKVKAELMNYYNIPSEKIAVIENGVQDYWFETKNGCRECEKIMTKWDKNKPTLVFLTRISKGNAFNVACKGIDRAYAVMKHTSKKINKVVIALTHETMINRFKTLFEKIGVHFIPNHPHDHLPHLLKKADLCIHASRYEGFGYALAETMALGIPSIAFPTGFVPETVNNRKNAIIVGNTEEMILAVEEMIKNDKLRKTIAKEGQKAVKEKYTLENMAEEYIAYFEKVLKNKKKKTLSL